MNNVKNIRKATIFSHLAIFIFAILFVKFAEKVPYIYETNSIKNTGTVVIDLIFAVLLILHFLLILRNLMIIFQKIIEKEKVHFNDVLWSVYPVLILLILSGFNISNLMNFIKSPFNIVVNSIGLYL